MCVVSRISDTLSLSTRLPSGYESQNQRGPALWLLNAGYAWLSKPLEMDVVLSVACGAMCMPEK